jgi:hypothetical protein
MRTPLPDPDKRALLAQYSAAYDRCQEAYDGSVRTLAAGGVAVSASLVTVCHHVSRAGTGGEVATTDGAGRVRLDTGLDTHERPEEP